MSASSGGDSWHKILPCHGRMALRYPNLLLLFLLRATTGLLLRFHLCGARALSREACYCERPRGGVSIAGIKGHGVRTIPRWIHCVCVVVFPEKTSDVKTCAPQMLRVHIQVQQASVCTSMNDFQLNLTKSNPFRMIGIALRDAVTIPSMLLCLCPRSCDVHFLEIHICALSTQFAGVGPHAKHRMLGALSTRNVYQNMVAWLHQVELLTVNILQVGIANGGGAGGWPPKARNRGRRRGSRARRVSARRRARHSSRHRCRIQIGTGLCQNHCVAR